MLQTLGQEERLQCPWTGEDGCPSSRRERRSTLSHLWVHLGLSTHTDKDRPSSLGLHQMFCPPRMWNPHLVCRAILQALPRCLSISCCPHPRTPPSLIAGLTSSASPAISSSSVNPQCTESSPPSHPPCHSKQSSHPCPKAHEGDTDKQHVEVAVFTAGPTGKSEWVKVAMVLAERRMESLKEGVSLSSPLGTTVRLCTLS